MTETRREPYHDADGLVLYRGDCMEVLASLPAESVSCCITSPPYWSLRHYDGPESVWPDGWRGQYGQEPSVSLYVEHTLEWMRAVKRVLRKDGVLWVDIGDSRGESGRGPMETASAKQRSNRGSVVGGPWPKDKSILAKSLCLIPERIALAASDDGWIVRDRIIIPRWMPEPVTDRCTNAYRMLYMFVKSKRYWWDRWAVRVASSTDSVTPGNVAWASERNDGDRLRKQWCDGVTRNLSNIWDHIPPAAYPSSESFRHFATYAVEEPETAIKASCPEAVCRTCGKPRVRIVKTKKVLEDDGSRNYLPDGPARLSAHRDALRRDGHRHDNPFQETHEVAGFTDCGHGSWACTQCGYRVQSNHATQEPRRTPQLSPSLVSGEGQGPKPRISAPRLPDLREGVLREKEPKDLQPEVRGQDASPDGHTPLVPVKSEAAELERRAVADQGRLHTRTSLRSSEGRSTRLRHAASPSDGAPLGKTARTVREDTSSQRSQARQSNRKPRNCDPRSPERVGDLPSLPQEFSSPLVCPQCRAQVWHRLNDNYEPGTVLDPFAGTGSTLVAAQKLGRKGIGIEISEDYCRQAVTRLTVGDKAVRRMVAAERAGSRQGTLWEENSG